MKANKLICLGVIWWNITAFADAGKYGQKAPLFLRVGEQRLIHLSTGERFSISGKAIRHTRVHSHDLLLKGVSPGLCTLFLSKKGGTETRSIHVESRSTPFFPKPLLQAMNLLQQTEVLDAGSKFILRGPIDSYREASGVAYLKQHFPAWIVDETIISPLWFEQNIREIQTILKSTPQLKLIHHEGRLLVQGAVPHDSILQGVIRRVRAIQPLSEFEVQTFKGFSPTLYFKVFLLEVKKEYTSRLGIRLEGILNQTLGTSLEALGEKGAVKVLSAPELVVKSPGQAELFAGGELPLRLRSRNNDQVTWKSVGLSLKLDVKEYNGEKVRLTIETELNHQNGPTTEEKFPEIKTNKIRTQVEGTIGKPMLLSGLIQEDSMEKMSAGISLSSVPILGKIFASKDFQQNRSELVAVLLPYREPPAEPMQRISSEIPKGYLPLPRNHLSLEEVENLKNSGDYPWNAL